MITIKPYLKLVRPYGMLFIGLAPLFCAVCTGETSSMRLGVLLAIGLLAHTFTFVQNDYFDLEVDTHSKYVSHRPLVIGVITQKKVVGIMFFSFFLSVALSLFFLFTTLSFFLLLLSFVLITLYNKYSKRFPGMEYVLGLGILIFGLFGAFSVTSSINALAWIIAAVGFFQWIFSVGVSANLKDVKYDRQQKIRTTPMILGVTTVKKELKKPVLFKTYVYSVKALHLISLTLPLLLGYSSLYLYGLPLPIFSFILLVFLLSFTTQKILTTPLRKRDTLLKYEGIHEGLALLAIPVVLLDFFMSTLGVPQTLLLIGLIIIWPLFFLRVLFGKAMIPLE
jgi:4-hydroxybenzoate polyprenyltransferase